CVRWPRCGFGARMPPGRAGAAERGCAGVVCRQWFHRESIMLAACSGRAAALAFGLFALFCVGANAQPAPDYAALIAAPDRSDNDRQADKRRDPLPFLTFAAVRPGMKVLDMGAGGGYSSEMLARGVTPGGVVYAQNPAELPERPKTAFEARVKTPAMKEVVVDIRPFDDPV